MRRKNSRRRGATVVEFATVAPAVLIVLFGLIVGGMGVFRYHQVAHLAREASRWASVRGAEYAAATGNPAATADDVYNQVIAPHAAAMNLSRLTYSVTWDADNRPYRTATNGADVKRVNNVVTVTVAYRWIPEAYLAGVTLSSTSSTPMAF